MCFSTNVSFAAGAILSIIGIITLKQARNKLQYVFATIPLLFGIQQIAEGFVWLSLTDPDFANIGALATTVFLLFAQVIWPFWVPVAILRLETIPGRKKILQGFTVMGALVSGYLGFCLVFFPFRAEIVASHIQYFLDFPNSFVWITGVFYFITTVVSPMASSNKKVSLLGITIIGSYMITKLFFTNYLVSVWCFFAAVTSAMILYILVEMNKQAAESGLVQPVSGN